MKREEHKTKLLRQPAEKVANEKGLMKQNPQSSHQYKNGLQLLEKTFASLREAVFIIDAKTTRILNCNPAALQIFGYRKEEMVGQTTNFLHVDEEKLEEFRKSLFSAVEERGYLDLPEFQMKRRNGEVIFTSHSVMPLEDDQGKRIGWVSVVRDITDRKRAEELLLKNENRLKRSQEIAHLGSWELDLVKNILTWSDEVYRIFGLQPQQFGATYEAFLEAVHPDDRPAVDAGYSGSLREGRDTYEIEHRVVRKSTGEIRYVHEKCEHVRDESGKIIRSAGMVHDITERRWIEEELRRSRDELELRVQERTKELKRQAELLDLTHDAIVVREMDGVITFWNKGAEEMYGWTKEEAKGKIMRDLLQTQFPIPRYEIMAKLMQEGRWEGELTHARKDGKKIETLCRWTLQRDEEGKPAGVMIISHDITERLKLEEQLRQAQKMDALGTLAGGIAHDFNNLLQPILINTELALLDIQEGKLPSLQSLQLAREATRRGQELVKQIITFSRQKEQVRKPVEINPIIKETLRFLKSTIPRTIEIRERIEAESAVVLADSTQIHQVLMNLCSNAAHAMLDRGGILDVSLARVEMHGDLAVCQGGLKPGSYLRLTVKDNGHGMDREVRERAFDPFFTMKKTGEGTGMGLAVVHGIVKKHEGAITLESEVEKGTTVSVFLPLVQENGEEEISALGPIFKGEERILLVDDEESIISSTKNMLERLGYRVNGKTDVREALAVFRSKPDIFDLVITDQTMPYLTGEKLARELLNIRSDIPIILCTGFSETVDEKGARAIGVRDVVMKPFAVRDMANVIRRVLLKK